MIINPFPRFETKRLRLEQLKKSDSKAIQFLRSDAVVNAFVKRPQTNSIDEAEQFITKINNGIKEQSWLFWAIRIKEKPNLVGTICLWNFSENRKVAEVGYDLHPDFHRKGIMNESLKCILEFGFRALKLDQIEAYTHRDNKPSKKLLSKNNFSYVEGKVDPDNLDNIIFSIYNNEYIE
ncbi:GNAT family N-acetyltransferase [Aquimarina sp. AU474]|uniref:GNAT family N-acetyltransferase n=1 Tax=Aquimarina sp. AU474 TaxID=2108529 RepID=UPI000D690032|nr:GNAT family N-acetyltransferase [Aquimarina sp. AU474]